MQEWRPVKGFNAYAVSDEGRVARISRGRGTYPGREVGSLGGSNGQYRRVALWCGKSHYDRYVHRLVAEAFLGPCPKAHEVNHKDGDPSNNALTNLEYVTSRENKEHAVRLRLVPSGLLHWNGRFKPEDIHAMRTLASAGFSQYYIAKLFDCTQPYVGKVVSGQKRKDS